MAERIVKVTLSAQVAGYVSAMDAAAKKTRELGSESEKLAQTQRAFELVGRSAFVAGGLMAAGLGVAVAKYADFDAAMSNVAATGQDAKDSIEGLRDAALDAGANTVFSASEAANAIEELSKAGVEAKDVLGGGLDGALDLAAAGGLGVADAAGIAATALKTFNLEGTDMSHVADLLAAGAGKAMGDVSDLGQALNQSALVADKVGLSIEETTAALAAFASQGLIGSDAGTSFKTMLLALNPASEEAADLMKELGLSAYDQQGRFVGLSEYAGELERALGTMSDEQQSATLKTLFGNDAYRAAAVLLDEGAAGIENWTEKVNDSGYAAETAATKLDNLKGDWEALTGAVDSAMIASGEAADGPLRNLVQTLTGVVDVFNDLPEGAQQAAFWIAAGGSAASLAYGGYLLLVPKIAEYNSALATMGGNAQKAGRGLAAVGKGVGVTAAVATVVTLASQALIDYSRELNGTDDAVARAVTTNEKFLDSMDGMGKTTKATAESVVGALDAIGSGNVLGPVGLDILSLRDSLVELDKGLEGVPLDAAIDKFQGWGEELGLSRSQMATLLDEMPGLNEAIRDHLTATGEAADGESVLTYALEAGAEATQDNEAALRELSGQAETTGDDIDGLADQIRNFGSATLSTREAQRQFQESIDAVAEGLQSQREEYEAANGTLDGFSASLDIGTQAGRDNEAALDAIAGAAKESAAAILEQTGSQDGATAAIQAGRDELILQLEQFGITDAAAQAYADQLGLIPGDVSTAVALTGVETAEYQLMNLARDRFATIKVNSVGPTLGAYSFPADADGSANGNIYEYADGGFGGGTGIYSGGTPLYKFAEPETGWEAFISGKQSERSRNIGIWQQAGDRLGVGGGGGQMGGVVSLSPQDRRLLERLQPNVNVNVGDQVVASASNRGNQNQSWRRG